MDELMILEMTIQTLNTVEVRGEDNLAAQLGAIRALKALKTSMGQPKEPAAEKHPAVTGVRGDSPALENLEVEDGQ